ncbi:MAG TPA: helix-turn-helix domain-containing protein [Acidobacteriota bacterium]|nr:helix-turn-helix domain-containing protein [Acidobacteriota bacterium]
MRSKGRINNYVGHRLREIRVAKKMTSQEVARRAGIAPGSYSCLENGWYKINLDNLFRILQVLKAEVTEVWPRADVDSEQVIDDDFLQDVVREAMESTPRDVTLDDVYEAVCESFDIPKDQFMSQSRWSRLTEARGAAALLIKDIRHLSMTGLCRSLGVSISSMSHLTRRVKDRAEEDADLAAKIDNARKLLEERFSIGGKKKERRAS